MIKKAARLKKEILRTTLQFNAQVSFSASLSGLIIVGPPSVLLYLAGLVLAE
jgi:hypothetical protein